MKRYPYQQISDDLRKQINDGVFAPGEKLPSESKLREQWGVSRDAVRRALRLLETETLVAPHAKRGWVVQCIEHMVYRPQTDVTPVQSADGENLVEAWAGQISSEGRTPSQTIEVAIVRPPEVVATRLKLDGETAVLRRRDRFINDTPSNLNDSYYPLAIAQDTPVLSPDDVPEGITKVLADLGHRQSRVITEIEVAMPTPEQQHRLQISSTMPVAVLIVTAFDQDEVPVRCTINVLPSDRHRIVFEHDL